jgi:heat-inducible transcriptional repressor
MRTEHHETSAILDDRKEEILRAIVEEYVESAQPVGSKKIAAARNLSVSAATIRNEMSALEREGYISQPHTSAGRVPTDLGYRYYVDHIADPAVLAPTQRREVAAFFASAARAMDDLLSQTSRLLARITTHAGVVVGPGAEVGRVRAVQLVPLAPDDVLVVVVLSDGAIARELVHLDHEYDAHAVNEAGVRLDDAWRGAPLASLPAVQLSGSPVPTDADRLVTAAGDAIARRVTTDSEPLFVGGASRLAAEFETFGSTGGAARVLELLEQHVVLASLIRELLGPGLTIRIGSETELDDLQDCSLVLAPYLVEGEPAGTVGILGPTRMDYRQAAAAVDTVSRRLGRQLSR